MKLGPFWSGGINLLPPGLFIATPERKNNKSEKVSVRGFFGKFVRRFVNQRGRGPDVPGGYFWGGGGNPTPAPGRGESPLLCNRNSTEGNGGGTGGGEPGGSQPDLCRPTDAPKPRGDPAGVGPWALPGRAGCGGGCGARWLAELPTSSTTTPPPRYLEGLEIGARGGRGGQGTQASRPHGDTWLGLGGGNQFFQCPPVLPNPSQCSTVTLNLSQWPPVPPIPLSAPPIPVLQSFPVPCNSSQCPPSAAQ